MGISPLSPLGQKLIEIMSVAQELIDETNEPEMLICPECNSTFYKWDYGEFGTDLCYRCYLGAAE